MTNLFALLLERFNLSLSLSLLFSALHKHEQLLLLLWRHLVTVVDVVIISGVNIWSNIWGKYLG